MRTALGSATAACLLGLGLIAPAPALAAAGSTISLDSSEYAMTYTAGPGQANRTTLSATTQKLAGNNVRWTWTVSDVAPITPGSNCSTPDPAKPRTVQCTVVVSEFTDFYPQHQFYLGDGADRIDFSAADATLLGGIASIHGGPGDDILFATGSEYLYGDAGNDTLTNGLVRGGDGNDTIINADDALGEAGNDTITGTNTTANGAGDLLNGGPGNDRITAGAGDDTVLGGTGNDTIYGNSGADTIFGNSGNDRISGGPGSDQISGGPGSDSITQ